MLAKGIIFDYFCVMLMTNKTIHGAYGFRELAILYFPNSAPQSASSQFKRWLNNPQLSAKLSATGYFVGQRILTPRQVQIILEHLGEP